MKEISKQWYALGALVFGLIVALPQLLALILLPLSDYGSFSVFYLMYALGLSVAMSVTMEPWSRLGSPRGRDYTRGYYSSLLVVSVVTALAVLVLAAILDGSPIIVLSAGLATLGYIYWSGSRYRLIQFERIRHVVYVEAVALMSLLAVGSFALTVSDPNLRVVLFFLAWAVPSLVLILGSFAVSDAAFGGLSLWFKRPEAGIRVLLSDSILMDLGAIGTPLLMAPFMGPVNIGIYRAVANVGFPARVLITAVRPMLHRIPSRDWVALKFQVAIVAVSSIVAVALVVAVSLVGLLIDSEVVAALSVRKWQVGLFAAANMYSMLMSIGCRSFAAPAAIIRARVLHTGVVVILPVVGLVIWDLDGAIWGFVISTLAVCVIWLRAAQYAR